MRISDSGRIVAYTGHDEEDERIYKFVSSAKYDADNREANFDLLSDGMLYVADFSVGRWVALDYENNPLFKDNGFKSQADVRSEEHTSELQSRQYLVCRLLLEKKKISVSHLIIQNTIN